AARDRGRRPPSLARRLPGSRSMPRRARKLILDPVQAAAEAGLRWVCDDRPGIRRRRAGSGFRYFDIDGAPLTDARARERIRTLAIPPAWRDVWICPT